MIFIVASLIIGAIVWYIHHKLTFWQRQGIPTPGLFYQWQCYRRAVGPYDQELIQKFGPVIGTYNGLTPTLIISEPVLIKNILVKEFQNFQNPKPFKLGIPLLDNSLEWLEGENWKRVRLLVTPAFTPAKVRSMVPIVKHAVEKFNEHLSTVALDGTLINIRKYYNSLAFDLMTSCTFGAKLDEFSDPNNPLSQKLQKLLPGKLALFFLMYFPKFAYISGLTEKVNEPFKFYEDMLKKLIEERNYSKLKIHRYDFLQSMMDASKEAENSGERKSSKKVLSNIEMMAQCLTFLVGGIDTVATTLACCCYYLSISPNIQENLIAELSEVDDIKYDTVITLKYLEAVIKETLRLSPPSMRLTRECTASTRIGNAQVEPGTIITVPIFALHRDPKFNSNPEIFDPKRFLEGSDKVNSEPFAYLPFGEGPRGCVGVKMALMQVKMALALIIKKYRFVVAQETQLVYAPSSYDVSTPLEIMLRVKCLE